jgi:serine-type D-Ala-D-Ala carboxypeptidase (penicillin-binding protein 5/6)
VIYMRKIISICLLLFLFVDLFQASAVTKKIKESKSIEPINISSKAAILVEMTTNRVLYFKNPDLRLPMASTTKIMTALITLEQPNKQIKITKEMIRVEGSSMGLKEGNVVSLKDLAAGMLLNSGNDAANSAAIAIGGSIEGFAKLMNDRADEMGLNSTNFVTPSGLDDKNHYTTAFDLARLACFAMQNPEFKKLASTKSMRVNIQNPDCMLYLSNHNRLLKEYEGANGVKTGFTKKSGRCLVSSAMRSGINLIAVTLSSPNDWSDHKKLLDYGFSILVNTELSLNETITIPVTGGYANSVIIKPQKEMDKIFAPLTIEEITRLKRHIYCEHFLYSPVYKGMKAGEVFYELDGKIIAKCILVAQSDVKYIKKKFKIF